MGKILLIVKGTFYLRNKGLIINGDITNYDGVIKNGLEIELKTPEGKYFKSMIKGIDKNINKSTNSPNLSLLLSDDIKEGDITNGTIVKLV